MQSSSSRERAVVRSRVVSTRVQPVESRTVSQTTTRVVKQVSSSSSSRGENRTFTETTVTSSKSASPQVRTVTKTTTRVIAAPTKRTKISDIITGLSDETVSARDALLKWAQRTTEHYPGVRVTDFTSSWKDGLAFNAILHRNRPDLLDFRSLKTRQAKENLELAFSIAEKEFGITNLLDPEDVDTPEPDEKSLITYISSMYDVFQEPPVYHPFADDERNRKVEEYKELAKCLYIWMHETLEFLRTQKLCLTLIDLKTLLIESSKFRNDEVAKKNRDKQRLVQLHKEIQKLNSESGHAVEFLKDLKIEEIEKNWNLVSSALQDRDKKIKEEICRLEKLQKSSEKTNKEIKQCDGKLNDLERKIKEEEKHFQRLHAIDAKRNCDQIENDLKHVDEILKSIKSDIANLEQKKYPQINEMKIRLENLSDKYEFVLSSFQTQLIVPLSSRCDKTVEEKKVTKQRTIVTEKIVESKVPSLKEHFEWIERKHKRVNEFDSGTDCPTIKSYIEKLKQEKKAIDQYYKRISSFQVQVAKENEAASFFEEVEKLQNNYKDLMTLVIQKLQNAEYLLNFVQAATRELKWMTDKEDIEIAQDWSAKNSNLIELEHHQESFTLDLEKHEAQITSLQNMGENLLQKNSDSKCIENYLIKLQDHWSWLLQLAICLEIHLKNVKIYHQFFKEAKECDHWLKKTEDKLNNNFNKSVLSMDEGERFLKQLKELKEDLTKHNDIIVSLMKRSSEVHPLKLRKSHPSKPLTIISICTYKTANINVTKDQKFALKDASQKAMWKVVFSSGTECMIPGVCFIIPPPNDEAIEMSKNLKKRYDEILSLWIIKDQTVRQNLILATIKVVKTWDKSQFITMDSVQRDSIIKALNADTEKLIAEGPSEPMLKKLKEEMEQCNDIYSSLLKSISEEQNDKSPKSEGRKISDTILSLQNTLNENEKSLNTKLISPISWDVDSLEVLVLEHKDFEIGLKQLEEQISQVSEMLKTTPRKTAALQMKYDVLINTWEKIWELFQCYIEKLKIMDVGIHKLNEATHAVSSVEVNLVECDKMSSNLEDLRILHDSLLSYQSQMQQSQTTIDDLQETAKKIREFVKKVRPKQNNYADVNKYENDVKKLVNRWRNARSQIVERLRSCGASSELIQQFKEKNNNDGMWISETTVKLKSLKTVKRMTTKEIELSVEPSLNLYSEIAHKRSSIEETNTLAARYIREAKAAVEENYKICQENFDKLTSWMKDIEEKLANTGIVQEELPGLQKQMSNIKMLKDELESQQHLVLTCLDQMRLLAQRGLDVLDKEELNTLQKNLISLKRQYDTILNECERLLHRLTTALDELHKFKTEMNTMKVWLVQAKGEFGKKEMLLGSLNNMEKNSEEIRMFTHDVIAHQADLRFATMAAQKFINESQEYMKTLNAFRTNLSNKLPPLTKTESLVKSEVQEITADYHSFLNNVNRLHDSFVILCNKYRSFCDIYDKASIWLLEIKKSSKTVLEEPLADEPRAVQEQLEKTKLINMEVVGQGRLVENTVQAGKILMDTIDIFKVTSAETKNIENQINSLQTQYSELVNAISSRIKVLQTATIQSQDIQDAVDRIIKWLEETEGNAKVLKKPISLNVEYLEQQVQDFKILKSEVDNQKQSLEMLFSSTTELNTSSNLKLIKKVDSKLKDISNRFEKLNEVIIKRNASLEEVSESVQTFVSSSNQCNEWISSTSDRILNTDSLNQIDLQGFSSALDYTSRQCESKKSDFDTVIKIGKSLIIRKDVTDIASIKDELENLENKWKNLENVLNEKKLFAKTKADQMTAYESLRTKIVDWLLTMERKVETLEPIAVDLKVLKKQTTEVMPLLKEHGEFSSSIEKMNNLGTSFETIGRGEMVKQKATSPNKKPPSPLRKSPSKSKSVDNFSVPSSKTQISAQSPLSTVSSGFSSRRSSTDNFDLTPLQLQMSEMNDRYNSLGMKLSDRSQEINSVIEEIQLYHQNLKNIFHFVEEKEKCLPNELLPSKDVLEKQLKSMKDIQKELLEKQSEIDNLKNKTNDILSKRKMAKGTAELHDSFSKIDEKWLQLLSNVKERIEYLESLKEFYESHVLLKNWLTQKQKMFEVLGPISSDPRMVATQLQQVQVMRDELSSQHSFMNQLVSSATLVNQYLEKTNSNTSKIKEKMDAIQSVWDEMSLKLSEREKNLQAVGGITHDFHKNLTEVQIMIQQLNEKFESYEKKGSSYEICLQKLEEMEEELEKSRTLMTDVDSVCEKLCDILIDSSSKSEIKSKISIIVTTYTSLKKKIDNKKAEVESSLKEDREYFQSCSDIQNWINEMDILLAKPMPLSANLDKLLAQSENFEPIYKKIMNREHEVHLCLNKGSEALSKVSTKQESSLKAKLDSIKKQWEKLKKIATDRNSCLRNTIESSKKYASTVKSFLPWLETQAANFGDINIPSLQRNALNKQLKELHVIKSNLVAHTQEYDNIIQLGEKLLSSCELDKDNAQSELESLKKKWKTINKDVIATIQAMEQVSQMVMEYEELIRDLQHSLQRLEDKFSSHESLGDVSRDPILLDRLQTLLTETKGINKEFKKVKDFAKQLIERCPKSDNSQVQNTLMSLENRYHNLKKSLEDKCAAMQASSKVISAFMDKIKKMKSEINSLDESFDKMPPVVHSQKSLQNQLKELKVFKSNLSKVKDKLPSIEDDYQNIIKEHRSESRNYEEQMTSLHKLINQLQERINTRETNVETMLNKLEKYNSLYSSAMKELQMVMKEEASFEISATDVEMIRSQQEAFKVFRSSKFVPLNKQIEEVNKLGQGLVLAVSGSIDTSDLEHHLEKLNASWNKLQESINEREKKLDIALLQSGKFKEAVNGIEKWIKDTEEMVSNQKAPSSDFKVVKAQIQEQKFLRRMLLDRQNSVISLKTMSNELTSSGKKNELEQAEKSMKEITLRFEKLISISNERMNMLEQIIPLAQEYQNLSIPLEEWLENTEKKLIGMSSVPIEEDSLKKMIKLQEELTKDITNHVKSIDQLQKISNQLIKIIGQNDTDHLKQKTALIREKFTDVKQRCENVASILKNAQSKLNTFFVSYNRTILWIEEISTHLSSYEILSISSDKLQVQVKDLKKMKEDFESKRKGVDNVIQSGEDIMKIASGEDAIQMKEKLDVLSMKVMEVSNKLSERLKSATNSYTLVEKFYSANTKLTSWLETTEKSFKVIDNSSFEEQEKTIKRLEISIHEYREVLEVLNNIGPRLCQISPGEGAVSLESLISRTNQKFEKVNEQIQRKAERIRLAVQRKYDVIGDIDELYEWFQETEKSIAIEEGISSEPENLVALLNKQKALNEEINGQKTRARETIMAAKKLMRESSTEDLSSIHEKIVTLKSQVTNVSNLCHEKLSTLEEALPLAKHFFETHVDLGQWLDEAEGEAELLEAPALNTAQIKKQQDRSKDLIQSVQEHKPLVDKLNKTGSALTKLCKEEEVDKLEVILESDNSRYNALRKILREHQIALEEALQATSQFSDKLEGMLNALTSTADQLHNAEPISAHPDRIQEQINDNKAVLQDLDKRTISLEAVKKAADDVITKAGTMDEPAVRDIKVKLDRLNDLWITIQTAARNRGKSLEEALVAAEKFWDELTSVMKALKELQGNLNNQEPPAVEPSAVQQQQEVLHEIKQEITQTKPEVDHCRQAGQNLMQLCGEPDKPEVKRHIDDLDSVWENVTTLYAKREQNLIDAMEKAMLFHDTLQNLLEFLDTVEDRFGSLGAVSSDIDSVKGQINQLKNFKMEVDPHMVEIESLNRQAQELMERTSSEQAVAIREPLTNINKRWDELLKRIVERQQEMENTLLKLGQFQHALEELIVWISRTEKNLDDLKPIFGDPQVIEVVLAKHKVISNDIQAHESSIDSINRAGHEFLGSDRNSEEVKFTSNKLQLLNSHWQNLQSKAAGRYKELEDALKEAQQFHQDIQDILIWLNDVDSQLVTSKPVGGLPETAKDQLSRFMDLYNELDSNCCKVENILQQGENYIKRSGESQTKSLQHSLRTLKQRWDAILNKANDRKIKLEIAYREATEFHEALQKFVEWLTNAEKHLTTLKPVSRYMKTVLEQIEEHRNFQKEIGAHREVILNLEKKGTHLKYFSQKQDVILIKNLLISVQHRWERVVSKAAERTRALDHGYKESKEFHDTWTSLSSWLDEAEKYLDSSSPIGNDPTKIKKLLSKHKEFQRTLGSKQVTYDVAMKSGRILKDKCPKHDVQFLQEMMDELKMRWNKVCSKSVDRQRRLEEALLYSGQFKEAVLALIDWLDKTMSSLSESKPYHGDLDTVSSLLDQHKALKEELNNRRLNLESVRKTAEDLMKEASSSDAETINSQLEELNKKWTSVTELIETKEKSLNEAHQLAEKLYKQVHILLEWMSEAEMKLRFSGPLPESEVDTKKQISEHENFMADMGQKEILKNDTLEFANSILKKCHPDGLSIIRHWITIIQSRWDEISSWAKQRDQRLRDHLLSLRDINSLLEELLVWLEKAESSLVSLESVTLPDDLPVIENLIKEHQNFMNDLTKRQSDVEKVTKAFSTKHQHKSMLGVPSKEKKTRNNASTSIKTSTPIRAQVDSDIKHPRASRLIDKWHHVWLLAIERQHRLQDKYNYLLELDRIKNFDFNEWRTRYISWLNNKKSRIMDQFKKIDKNNVGKVTKQEFIDGILKSKFTTSHLEMVRVADIFDVNEDGFIDSKEYIETLRPDREGKPKTDAEKIQDEVQRQVAKCTCVHRFKVYQVGEGKYRFGDSQKLRLVRILRSTVMVRVGGGWVALDEFLVKNDPCRAKGRTNIELREQFILAEGVSQSMAPFKPKASSNSSVSSPSLSGTTSSLTATGPITKIREKSERSTPMRRSSGENSSDISGPSFSETDSFSNRSSFTRASPSSRLSVKNASCRSSSRPSSQQGSRPSSRAPSDLSQDGFDEYKSKRRSTTAAKHFNSSNSDKSAKSIPEVSRIPSAKRIVKPRVSSDGAKQ